MSSKVVTLSFGHGTFGASLQALAQAEKLSKQKLATRIAQAYEDADDATHRKVSYWLSYSKTVLTIVFADLYLAEVR